MVHDHHHASLRLRDLTENAKKDAIRNAGRVSDLLVDVVNGGVQEAFINEKRIELEIRALAATISRFMKQTDQWLTATHAINTAIKEIGDFENWMKTMEFDCKSINAAIHNIHQR
ncbi:Biogenesis of lysosome-related organelles complex 1 subunit 1 [Morella rubra]|uniref:Biogenesis of lysosome-related organelles complex 1 subunit 1 n=1 Tax=Morella rubra TaxID=262757 RepID=A0A6A1WPM0_9ROSI|nr:Biogenesis of lysosome-related organelles complex 1 subunit 1 [Morella rubra]